MRALARTRERSRRPEVLLCREAKSRSRAAHRPGIGVASLLPVLRYIGTNERGTFWSHAGHFLVSRAEDRRIFYGVALVQHRPREGPGVRLVARQGTTR